MSRSSVAEAAPITDPDDAYANAAHVAGSDAIIAAWPERARDFRSRLAAEGRSREGVAYGRHARERMDVFAPAGTPRGVALFVHGGYWMRFDRADFSWVAAGALARGWLVVVPSYPLCPEVGIDAIGRSLARAVGTAAALAAGPIRTAGHSAGGQLVARLLCDDAALDPTVAGRLDRTLALSGVHDLVPLLGTTMNATLGLERDSALAESPARRLPRPGARVCAWVGAAERPEFLRQSALLANVWHGVGARVASFVEPARHHFDLIDALEDADSAMIRWWLGDG